MSNGNRIALWDALDQHLGEVSSYSGLAGSLRDLVARTPYDSRRGTRGYDTNHFVEAVPEGERIVRSYPGTIARHGTNLPAVIHETDRQSVLVDTYRMPKPPVHAGLANAALSAVGLRESYRLAPGGYERTERDNHVEFTAGATSVRGLTDIPTGRINDLPPGEQLRQAWRLARGR